MGETREYFPLFVSLKGKRIFIAGAGKIAARRAENLLSFGAEVFVAAPECSEEMVGLLRDEKGKKLCYRQREFVESDLQGMDIVLAATDNSALNHRITETCRKKNIPVNNASDQSECDFFFPAIVQADGLTIGVVSGGRDHKKVALVCEKIRQFFEAAMQGKGSEKEADRERR